MSIRNKTFQELDLCNSFLFAVALEQPEICRLVLEIILGYKVPHVKVHPEHSVLVSSDFRSVRFDVYARDELLVAYDVEAQNENEGNLPKRSRYYQAELDVSSLRPGEDFNELKPGYVIFICTFDPFGMGLYRYTFEERCLECDLSLGDGTRKIFLNTKGKNDAEVPAELVHFLKYMEESTDAYVAEVTEESIIQLHERVTELKKRRELEARFMTGEELMRQRERKGRLAGLAEGKAEFILEFLEDCGTVPEDLKAQIYEQKDAGVLSRWHKLSAKVDSIEQFMEQM